MVPEWYQEYFNARIKRNRTTRKWSNRRQEISPMPHAKCPLTGAFNCGTAGSGGQWGRDVTVFPTKGTIIRPGARGNTLRMR
jgi:hypothetical protein